MSEEHRREIRRREISRKVIGSANPAARWGRHAKASCWDSISGFFVGLVLFLVTFSLPYCAAKTEKDSKQLAMDVTPVAQAASLTGIATVQGPLTAVNQLQVPYAETDKPVLAYDFLREDWETWEETHNETHTETVNGKDEEVTEEVTEEVSGWKELTHELQWSPIRLGSINIDHNKCRIELPWQQTYQQEFEDNGTRIRDTVKVVEVPQDAYLYAEFTDGQIAPDPDFARLSTRGPEAQKQQMNKEEESGRWLKIIAAIILWTISLNLLLGPAMLLINIIPVQQIGAAVRAVLTFVSFVIACIMTFVTYTFIRYWWVFVLLLVVLAVVVTVSAMQRRQAAPDLDVDEELEPGPEPKPEEPG
jgi:hypothetical protein